jgi:hypothetical protein
MEITNREIFFETIRKMIDDEENKQEHLSEFIEQVSERRNNIYPKRVVNQGEKILRNLEKNKSQGDNWKRFKAEVIELSMFHDSSTIEIENEPKIEWTPFRYLAEGFEEFELKLNPSRIIPILVVLIIGAATYLVSNLQVASIVTTILALIVTLVVKVTE